VKNYTAILFILAICACAGLNGCAADQMKPFLDNLSHDCTRHYTGSVGGTLGTATVAFDISCAPEGTTTTTTVTTPKPAPAQ
jgi:hypothetical protein